MTTQTKLKLKLTPNLIHLQQLFFSLNRQRYEIVHPDKVYQNGLLQASFNARFAGEIQRRGRS
jgi:hypothetical protein